MSKVDVGASYFLPNGYVARVEPEYFVDENLNAVWQPDLYSEAGTLARRNGSVKIIDIGCGTAAKLVTLYPEFEIVGIDFGSNIAACRDRYAFGTWIEVDLDARADLDLPAVADATIVCGDVIEHLVHPELLLRMLRRAINDGAAAVLLSTPDRELISGRDHLGPPHNKAHVREWTQGELKRFLASENLHGYFGFTRSNDVMPHLHTILAAVPGETEANRGVMRDWFEERKKWQQLAVEQDRIIGEHEAWIRELESAKSWAQEQYVAWKARAETAERALADRGLSYSDAVASGGDPADAPRTTRPSRITIVTEVEGETEGVGATWRSILGQSFRDWEWALVSNTPSMIPPADDSRVRVVVNPSRSQALRDVLAASGEVAVVEAGEILPATALEKWLWFLEASPECMSVQSSLRRDGSSSPRLLRRGAIDDAGSFDAAVEVTLASAGFVPIPDGRPREEWGRRSPATAQRANESLPPERSIRNPVKKTGRRLLLITPFMTMGGSDKVSLNLIDQLGARGWEFTVATTIDGPHDLYPEYHKRTADLFPLAHFVSVPYYPQVLRYLIDSRKPDVVMISNSELGYRLLPYLRGMCPETPIIDLCHSIAEHWNNGGYPRFSVEHRQFLDLTLTAYEGLRQWMIDRGGNEARIEVCYANVDVDAYRPAPDAAVEVRRRLGLPSEEPIVLFAGRISEDKQPRVLAAALGRLRQRKIGFTVVIAGDGPERPWLERALNKDGSARRVRILGEVPSEDMAPLMAAADVLFLPSRSEGIALALYESMASGTPVVGARVGGQAELVTEDCGLLIERSSQGDEADRYANALGQLLADHERRVAMGAAARTRVEEEFSLERLGQRADELLEHAIRLHQSQPQPRPTPSAARVSATQTLELVRLSSVIDASWHAQRSPEGAGTRLALYMALRRVLRPAYYWGTRRGMVWLPRLRDVLLRKLVGLPR